jgi:(S)-2-hydroxy-acid oxidase
MHNMTMTMNMNMTMNIKQLHCLTFILFKFMYGAFLLSSFNALPAPHRLANYDESHTQTYNAKAHKAWDQNSELLFDQNITWADVTWLKNQLRPYNLPLVIKGIMTAQDAQLAIQAGADGIMVSNHGGRQLDSSLATIDALPQVVQAVAGRVPVLLDGGIRRGVDVVKALALGATAVGIGRPIFFALAVNGQEGVVHVLQMLKQETETAMALCGCKTVADITRQHVTRHPNGTFGGRYLRSSL